ncbi:hypothetical protein DdX_16562 [Ditylenchus destructor]|uniref:F-box domain-containing protein n=1 Tax=Ditylenchus destructor TaxID=166010 RepID=A0AAD4MPE2_9BILA|nr:hypothetical protein DdX_16562 [Ditylenchus destructor]
MNNISQSKLLRPWTWIGRRKRPSMILPPETLIHILHYFPRKQLVKRYSLVNSSFFHVANRFLPNVHVIEWGTQFCFEHQDWFKGLVLCKFRNHRSKIGRLFCAKAKQVRDEIRISAEEFLENMPPGFIRFPKFYIGYCPDFEVLYKFLRCKQHFVNCRLHFGNENPDEKYLQKAEEMLSETFLNPSAIYFDGPRFASDKIFKTTGARNCDKIYIHNDLFKQEIEVDNDPKCTKLTFMDWIQWKQKESGSRRHLVLFWWRFDAIAVQEILEDLKHAFVNATKSLSYVITFGDCLPYNHDETENPSEFHLDNERTGERLSLFEDKKLSFRLWRRTVTSSDATWLLALIGGEFMEKEVKEAARETGFDEEFYDYCLPVIDPL